MSTEQITTKHASWAFANIVTKTITFSVAILSLLTQSTVVYAQSIYPNVSRDHSWIQQQPEGSKYFRIMNASGLCLGVVGVDNHRAGAPVEVYFCDRSPGYDQQWYKQSVDGYYRIKNRVSGLCLSVVGVNRHGAGDPVEVYYCYPSTSDSKLDAQWSFNEHTTLGFGTFRNRVSGLCLGVVGLNRHTAGARAEVYNCDG